MCPVNNESFAFTDMITVFGQASSRLLQYIYIMVSMLVVLSCSEGKKEKIVTPWGEVGVDSVPKNLNFTVDDIISNGELIILTLSGPETYYDYRGRGMGTQYLLCEKFAEKLGVSLRVEVCKDTAEMVSRLENGDADLIAVPLPKKQNTGKGLLFCGAGVDSLGIQWAVADGNKELADSLDAWFKPSMYDDIKREERYMFSAQSIKRHVYSPFLNRQSGVMLSGVLLRPEGALMGRSLRTDADYACYGRPSRPSALVNLRPGTQCSRCRGIFERAVGIFPQRTEPGRAPAVRACRVQRWLLPCTRRNGLGAQERAQSA